MSNVIQQYYNERGPTYGMNSLRREKVLRLASEEGLEGKRILDIGCASGYFGRELKRDNNTVIGIDISPTLVQEARKNINEAYVLDIENEDWPRDFKEKKFDLIICAEVIEHLFDQESFLKNVQKILKEEGGLILTTPNFLLWNNRIRMLFGQYSLKEVFYDKSHIHLMSYNGLREKIRNSGLAIVKEDNIWYPNKLENIRFLLPPNLFVFQTIIKLEVKKV